MACRVILWLLKEFSFMGFLGFLAMELTCKTAPFQLIRIFFLPSDRAERCPYLLLIKR
jgi:hypothetical protein